MPQLTASLIEARLPKHVPLGRPVPKVSEADLRRGADAILSERVGDGLWVFAYGALIWERSYTPDQERVGTVQGMARRYCLHDDRNRGTPDCPSLTLGLEPARDACVGVALHLAEDGLEDNFWAVWQHEMAAGFYDARFVQVATEQGTLDALTFVADPLHPLYAGTLPDEQVAAILATTVGPGGPAADYLQETADAMRRRDAPDPYLDRLAAMVAARLA